MSDMSDVDYFRGIQEMILIQEKSFNKLPLKKRILPDYVKLRKVIKLLKDQTDIRLGKVSS